MSKILVVPSVGYWRDGKAILLDRKFYDGIVEYAKIWSGEIALLIRESNKPKPAFGLVKYDSDHSVIKDMRIMNVGDAYQVEHFNNVDLVLASADDYTQTHLYSLSHQANAKCIYIIEYTLKTRLQILNAERKGLLTRAKTLLWLLREEWRIRRALTHADGIQANGAPAYDTYSSLNSNTMMYFDNRVNAPDVISPSMLDKRLDKLGQGGTLRLAFSGRLLAIKGADYLVPLAIALRERGVSFEFHIFGDGELMAEMRSDVERYQLADYVYIKGAVDFANQLVPFVKQNVDLFVCCHVQGDPSCTYLETYSCGVPIVGYDNAAHQGILDRADLGWSVKLGNVAALADLIATLDKQRKEIALKARRAQKFAEQHTFEMAFQARIKHCGETVNAK